MFSYNDGKLHEQVEAVIGGTQRIKLRRLGTTTQFVAPNRELQHLRHQPLSYKLIVDGQPVTVASHRAMSEIASTAEKEYWNGTPFIHVRSRAAIAPPTKLIYVIPGNPGLCEFYAEFIEALSELVPDAEIVAVSYIGYNVDTPDSWQPLHMLDEQIQHKLDFLDFYMNRLGQQLPIYVLGHSIGSWITQRVAMRRPDVVFVGLLTPTIKDIALSERGRSLVKMSRFIGPQAVWSVVYALKWVPFYQLALTRLLAHMMPVTEVNGMARDASLGIALKPQVCRQIVGLGLEEMERINSEIEAADIRGFWTSPKHKVWACFAENDYWVSQETREQLIEHARALPNVLTETVPVQHAFVLRESESVAALAARQINKSGR